VTVSRRRVRVIEKRRTAEPETAEQKKEDEGGVKPFRSPFAQQLNSADLPFTLDRSTGQQRTVHFFTAQSDDECFHCHAQSVSTVIIRSVFFSDHSSPRCRSSCLSYRTRASSKPKYRRSARNFSLPITSRRFDG
jgi:hypothetical protein